MFARLNVFTLPRVVFAFAVIVTVTLALTACVYAAAPPLGRAEEEPSAKAVRGATPYATIKNEPAPIRRTIMKVFALGLFAKPLTDEQRKRILPKEVPDTLRLYLDGKIDQFWFREDKPGGVVFLMNSASVKEAKSIVEALPLAANGYLVFEYIPVGPLRPLGLLIRPPEPE
jgi:hypothetical protein